MIDHVIPTSKMIHGRWSASTDNYTGVKDYWVEFYYIDATGEHSIFSCAVTGTQVSHTMSSFPSVGNGRTYYLRVKARDNSLNESSFASSAGVVCNKVKVGFCYQWCLTTDYYKFADEIDSFISSVTDSGIEYTRLNSHIPDDSYDILIIALPNTSVTSSDLASISSWLKRWHRRIILVGDNGFQMYAENGRLNSIVTDVGIFPSPAFSTSGSIFSGIDTSRHLLVNPSTYLTRNVDYLLCASAGAFNGWGSWVANGDADVYVSGYTWIVETDLSPGGHAVLIHDEGLFLSQYHRYGQDNFVRNICSVFE